MPIQLSSKEVAELLPAGSAAADHCRRVAALAVEIGTQMALSPQSSVALEQAALLHHTPEILIHRPALNRLAEDLWPGNPSSGAGFRSPALPDRLTAILQAFHNMLDDTGDAEVGILAEIVTLSNFLDEQIELASIEPRSMTAIWRDLGELRGLFHSDVLQCAEITLGTENWPTQGSWSPPACALAAKDIFRALSNPEVDLPVLTGVANRDPVLAGRLVQTANAALFARRSRVRSVAEAVAFIGADTTRKVLMALALEPMFLSAKLHSLWRHSLWAAQFCEGVARATGFMLPDDAMLLGLVHDIGSVSVQSQRRDILCKAARLSERGCPAVYVERLLLGKDHGEIGAQILASWDFDDELIEAVRYHHQPADTDLAAASVLHVAEFWAETGEDMCSIRHLSLALSNTGCSNEILARAERFQGSLSDLLRVA